MNKKITIVIVTYNARQYLPECLSSVYHQNYPKNLVKIVVIDNDSSDNTIEYLKSNYPEIKVIANRHNAGFAKANNQGWFLAEKNGSDCLALLNQDTIVEPNWLLRMSKILEHDEKVAIVQPKLLLYPEKDLINSFGNSIHFLGFAFCNKYREKNNQSITTPFELPYASGAACLIRMSALEKIGLFNSDLFMYHEDVDLGWRARLAGYKVMLDPLAVVWHKYNYSKAKYKFYYMDRNRFIVMFANYRLATVIVFLPVLVVMELGIFLFSIKNGWFKEKIKGYGWLWANMKKVVERKLNSSEIRKVSDRKILSQFVGAIKFQELDNPILKFVVNPITQAYFWVASKIIFW